MAEGGDRDDKTEEPTQKRLDDARQKGQVANSREMSHWLAFVSAAVVLATIAPGVARRLVERLSPLIERPHTYMLDEAGVIDVFIAVIGQLGLLLLLPLAALAVAGAIASFLQNGVIFATDPLAPKLERISPLAGIKRLFSMKAVLELAKGILKVAIVAGMLMWLLWPRVAGIESMTGLEPAALAAEIAALALHLLIAVVAFMTIVAAADILWQRFDHRRQMRMSRQDLKEEFKQQEGDPLIKQRLRQIRMERQRRRMMAAVPTADVVLTNPTHFAVALKYEQDSMRAPRVVAKGVDAVALRIRAVAGDAGVPVVENPPLARALHAAVEIDQEIPSEHYKAVAEVIGFVWRARGKRPGRGN